MSEAVYNQYEQDERERKITYLEIKNQLDDPLNHAEYPVVMVFEQSGMALFRGVMEEDLSEWTDDVLDAFRIDKSSWSERIIDPKTKQLVEPAKAACISGDMSDAWRNLTLQHLQALEHEGFSEGEVMFQLDLGKNVHVDLYGGGRMWTDPGATSTELGFRAVFRKVA